MTSVPFSDTTPGTPETFTAPATGVYTITAKGGQGGQGSYGASHANGAEITGDFTLAAGEELQIIVGAEGGTAHSGTGVLGAGGGGGGSFVLEINNGSVAVTNTPLVIAGGGGGGGYYTSGQGGLTTKAGGPGGFGTTYGGGSGGSSGGAGGGGGVYGGGGGGYAGGTGAYESTAATDGHAYTTPSGSGFSGGSALGHGGAGGYGGGGAGGSSHLPGNFGGGGGGGGYSGGGGGGDGVGAYSAVTHEYAGGGGGGGGGGSLDNGTNQVLVADENSGNGSVTITQAELCYLHGTRILTPTGEIPIETLRTGDTVVTRWQGIQPVKWVGRQSYDARFVRNNLARVPVRVGAGALAERTPARDLFVSPGHSMLLDGTLVLAGSLVNGVTITQNDIPETIRYFQLDLGTHDCVIAEGAWSETYADCEGLREQFHNLAEFHELYPDHRPPDELTLCAPRPERGAKLEAALRPVVARASDGLRPGPLRGWIDRIGEPLRIDGWAQDEEHPDLPVLLEVSLDGRMIGTALAYRFRQDLLDAGIGRGRCGFVFSAPVKIQPEAMRTLLIRRAIDGAALPMSGQLESRLRESENPRLRLTA